MTKCANLGCQVWVQMLGFRCQGNGDPLECFQCNPLSHPSVFMDLIRNPVPSSIMLPLGPILSYIWKPAIIRNVAETMPPASIPIST